MDVNDHDLDALLQRRASPPPAAPGWERHVVDAAFAAGGRRASARWGSWMDEMRGLLVLPRPAYALAACLMIGIASGALAEPVLDLMQQDQSLFVYMEDETI